MTTPIWTDEDSREANIEQWDVWDTDGSDNGPYQLCRIDFPEDEDGAPAGNIWEDDHEVWLHVVKVATGDRDTPHYRALRFLEAHNPTEINAIEAYVKQFNYSAILAMA